MPAGLPGSPQLLHSPACLLQRRHLLRQGFNLILHRTIAAANLGSAVVTPALASQKATSTCRNRRDT